MPSPSAYDWLYSELFDAGCVTVVAGATAADVLAAFGADRSKQLDMDEAAVAEVSDEHRGAVGVTTIPGGVVAVETNGYQGSIDEVLVRLSRLGPTASMFWNVESDNAFSSARDGEVVDVVDLYDADEPGDVSLRPDLMELFLLAAGDDAPHSMMAIGMAMVEAFTTVPVSREAVASARPFYAIPR